MPTRLAVPEGGVVEYPEVSSALPGPDRSMMKIHRPPSPDYVTSLKLAVREQLGDLPSEDEFARLPRLASVALVAQRLERVLGAYPTESDEARDRLSTIKKILDCSKNFCIDGEPQNGIFLAARLLQLWLPQPGETSLPDAIAALAGNLAVLVEMSSGSETRRPQDVLKALGYYAIATRLSDEPEAICDLRKEFGVLERRATAEKWNDETLVSSTFFDPDTRIHRDAALLLNDLCVGLCHLIAENGRAGLDLLHWRQLEETIGIVLEGLGFDVTVTDLSNDGGKDVVAECVINGERLTYYIEIKHWRSGKRVGSGCVSSFIEVNLRDNTQGGLFLASRGFAPSVVSQLSEITANRIRLGTDMKIIHLCQQFVRKGGRATWEAKDILPKLLFDETLPPGASSAIDST